MQVLVYSADFLVDLWYIIMAVALITVVVCLVAATVSICRCNKKTRQFYEKADRKLDKKNAKVEIKYED